MLRLMRRQLEQGLKPKTGFLLFSSTRRCGKLLGAHAANFDSGSNDEPSVIVLESLLDELRLEGEQYEQHSLMALERFFAIREADGWE